MVVVVTCFVALALGPMRSDWSKPQRVEINLALSQAEDFARDHAVKVDTPAFDLVACEHLTDLIQESQSE